MRRIAILNFKGGTGESMKNLMLGEESYKRKSTRQQNSMPAKQDRIKKVTYHIKDPALVKKLKLLGIEMERDLSSLVTEAIEDLIKKYK